MSVTYYQFLRYCGIQWKIPKIKKESKPIRIPTKEKLEMLIASAGRVMSVKLQLSYETGLRPVELHSLKVKDVDLEQRLVYPSTAKFGNPRTLKISTNLTTSLQAHIIRQKLRPNDRLFTGDETRYGKEYREVRNNLVKKLNDPTIHNIRLYDFRHYFATMLYHKTKDLVYTKQQMGHKRVETTLIYTQLLNLSDDEWTCQTASTVDQAKQLIENGFEYVTEMNGFKIFRKRK